MEIVMLIGADILPRSEAHQRDPQALRGAFFQQTPTTP